jgi:hypothetical protein
MIGVNCGTLEGVLIVIECFVRNAVASARLGVEEIWGFGELLEGVEEASTGVEDVRVSCAAFSIFIRFFFSFLSFLDSDVLSVSAIMDSSCSSRLRFFFFSLSSVGGIESVNHR